MKDCGLVIPVVYLKNIFPNKGRYIFIIMLNQVKSALFSIKLNDVEKAIIMATLTPVAAYIGQILTAFATGGSFVLSWTMVWHYALAGFTGYIVKNYFTNSQGQFLQAEPPKPKV
jgi:hypothetical protein